MLKMNNENEIKNAFTEMFDKADCIQHWGNTRKNDVGTIVSTEKVQELWVALEKHRTLRNLLKEKE